MAGDLGSRGTNRRMVTRTLAHEAQLLEESLVGTLTFKGGGYAGHHFLGGGFVRLRHHWWTGTNDNVPRTDGVPPLNGGLEKPPSRWRRFVNWFKWIVRGGK